MVSLNFLNGDRQAAPNAAALPPHERFYDDSFEWPKTPLQQDAERAYRRAFMKAAREAASWAKIEKAKSHYRKRRAMLSVDQFRGDANEEVAADEIPDLK